MLGENPDRFKTPKPWRPPTRHPDPADPNSRWQLPEQPWTSAAHCGLLQQMQQLVELRESVRVMYDISTVGGGFKDRT